MTGRAGGCAVEAGEEAPGCEDVSTMMPVTQNYCNSLPAGLPALQRILSTSASEGLLKHKSRSTEGFQDSDTTQNDTRTMAACPQTFVQTHRMNDTNSEL